MKTSLLFRFLMACVACFCAVSTGPIASAASVEPVELRCEYMKEPLGWDVAKPRLSWRLEAVKPQERGVKQTSYEILVASSLKWLSKGRGDLWASGIVLSDESVNLAYDGRPLESGQACFWKVRVRDQNGKWSGWSPTAHWTMGLLRPTDWRAQWIGTGEPTPKIMAETPLENTQPDPWFRKTFELAEAPSRAVIYVASVGYHELYVNGQKVGDAVLEPSVTDHKVRARYRTYDIAKRLKPGRNVIALWLGVSWSIFPAYQTDDKPSAPIVLAQADIQLPKAGKVQLVTDQSWKTHPSPNLLLGCWDANGFGGERYDANLEVPNWAGASLDDSIWKNASVFHPQLILSPDKTEPNRLIKEIKPVSLAETSNGVYRVDMGVNYAGWFEMELRGRPGDRVEFRFSEHKTESMSFGLHSEYVLGPSGKATFRNRFNYMSGRWVQVTGLRTKPELKQIRGWLISTDYQKASGFECDQPLLNQIYNTTLWTFENLSLGSYVVDCPQRERRGYGGDAIATTRTGLDNYQLGAFYTKWAEDWRDVQELDGSVPYTAPTQEGGGGPSWSGFCVTLPWQMYRTYGDRRILEQGFPTMQRWLGFLETKSDQDMLVRWGGRWSFLGDWVWPEARIERARLEKINKFPGDTREALFFNNCYWIYNLDTAAKIAEVLGNTEAASAYRTRANVVRAAVQKAFFNPVDNGYVNGFPGYMAIALEVSLPPLELRPAVWNRLQENIEVRHKGHIWAGITAGGFLLNTLVDNNRSDLIYGMACKQDFPSWGDLLKNGNTTFGEDWSGGGSGLHSSFLYIGSWFIEGLGGIRQPEQGFKHFVVQPWIDPRQGPRSVRAHYDSLYGRIATTWTLDKSGVLHLSVTVPPNTDAILRLRDLVPDSIQESGFPLNLVKGVSVEVEASNLTALRLEPGKYEFNAKVK